MTDAAAWGNFFVAEAGAAAALAGLLFVAISINLTRILQLPHLPGRAAQALITIFLALVTSSCGLIPQPPRALGVELLAVGLLGVAGVSAIQRRAPLPNARLGWRAMLLLTHQLPIGLFAVAGLSLLAAGRGGGLYWLGPATLLAFSGGVLNAWVLLIEIQR